MSDFIDLSSATVGGDLRDTARRQCAWLVLHEWLTEYQ